MTLTGIRDGDTFGDALSRWESRVKQDWMQMSREDEDAKRTNELCALGINTPIELVKHYIPDATDEFADWLLWEKTSFPTGGIVDCERGIKEYVKEDVK